MKVGDRVEISPHYDLWMRGARFGVVHSIALVARATDKGGLVHTISKTLDPNKEWETDTNPHLMVRVRMDHPQIKNLQRFSIQDLKVIKT